MSDFSDFRTVDNLKFDVSKLQNALQQILHIKKYGAAKWY